MNTSLNDMTEAELAEWQYAHRDELESDDDEVEVEISPQLSVTISFRLPGAEADAIREAARDAEVSLSAWILQACADTLEPDDSARSRLAVQAELRAATRELEALVRRLHAAARRGSSAAEGVRKKKAVRKKPNRTATGKSSRRT